MPIYRSEREMEMSPAVASSSFAGAVPFLPVGGLVSRGQPGGRPVVGPAAPVGQTETRPARSSDGPACELNRNVPFSTLSY